LKECIPLDPTARAIALEDSNELEGAHTAAAVKGDTAPPSSAEDDVDFHYVAFVASKKNGRVYEMDGTLKGPVDTGIVLGEGEDVLDQKALKLVKDYVNVEEGKNIGFSLLALVPKFS
jgi:ubiquitin carboxyl-terminal hydrolase L3